VACNPGERDRSFGYGITVVVILVAKFAAGAWVVVLLCRRRWYLWGACGVIMN